MLLDLAHLISPKKIIVRQMRASPTLNSSGRGESEAWLIAPIKPGLPWCQRDDRFDLVEGGGNREVAYLYGR